MRFQRVADWLRWQEGLHPRAIDPGLERVRTVASRMGLDRPEVTVLTVGGTNGKGSTVAFLESLAVGTGYWPGVYTSPHILEYNERIRLGGAEVTDSRLLRAFDAVDRARDGLTLSFFEFGTLAALWCFRDAGCEPWILEVGLGGRLDAVNVLDAHVAAVTSVALDHADWLGSDLDGIAREKAGICRAGRPVVCGMSCPPAGLRQATDALGADWRGAGVDFTAEAAADRWHWRGRDRELQELPLPVFAGGDTDNAATALAVWESAGDRLAFPDAEVAWAAVAATRLPGRFDWLDADWLLDVAHNPASAERLAEALSARRDPRPLEVVVAVMGRKDLDGVIAALAPVVDLWYPLALPDADAWPVETVAAAVRRSRGRLGGSGTAEVLLPRLDGHETLKLVCGSFRLVETVMRWHAQRAVAGC